MCRIEAGQEAELPRPKYRKEEERIFSIVKKFHDNFQGSYLAYLKSITHNVSIAADT